MQATVLLDWASLVRYKVAFDELVAEDKALLEALLVEEKENMVQVEELVAVGPQTDGETTWEQEEKEPLPAALVASREATFPA